MFAERAITATSGWLCPVVAIHVSGATTAPLMAMNKARSTPRDRHATTARAARPYAPAATTPQIRCSEFAEITAAALANAAHARNTATTQRRRTGPAASQSNLGL